jgi:hypothetical protein
VHFFIAIGVGYRKLVMMKAKTSQQYVRRCLSAIAPDIVGKYLCQDGAKCHTSNHTKKYLERKGIHAVDWPARSPDLNPAEKVFAWLKREIQRDAPWGEEQLRAVIKTKFEELPQQKIDNWCGGFVKALQECQRCGGAVV